KITHSLIVHGYLDSSKRLTEKYYDDVQSGSLVMAEEVEDYKADIVGILSTIYNPELMKPEDARAGNVEAKVDEKNLHRKEFQALWNRINAKSAYVVNFDSDELIRKSINALDGELRVNQIFITVEQGEMGSIESK